MTNVEAGSHYGKVVSALDDAGVTVVDEVRDEVPEGVKRRHITIRVVPENEGQNVYSAFDALISHVSQGVRPLNVLPRVEERFLEARTFNDSEIVSLQVYSSREAVPQSQPAEVGR